jgi:hypothetical protein
MRFPFSLSDKSIQIIRGKASSSTTLITAIRHECLQYFGTDMPHII